ncbi:hypothetical protein BDY24DRAFT_381427 [Mrakia frigida]|uniref:uncharacterized protein n=1 Tax=Mrakia frigida TaxID=29902 RepID=UPI003FCC179D
MADSDYDSTPNEIPPFPTSLLSSLLSYLIPAPNPPLPPDLISTALLHRHQFLPPSLDDPIAHFVHSKDAAEQRDEVAEALDGVGRLMGEGEHPSLTPEYNLPDPHTLQARILLYSSPASSPPPSLALLFLYEGTTNGWRYHDLRLLFSSESSSSEPWTSNLSQALAQAEERRSQAEQQEREKEAAVAGSAGERENVEGDGVVASSDDFWSGFSDEEEGGEAGNSSASAIHPPSIPSPNEPQTPPLHHSDSHETPSFTPSSPSNKPSYLHSTHSSSASLDDYWGRYGQTEDGIAPSAPSSPGVSLHHPTSNANHHSSYQTYSGQQEHRQVWGTGGETPISWTPNPEDQSKDDQASYFLRSDADDNEDEQGVRGFYASGGGDAAGGRPRGRTVTADDVLGSEEGTYPVFPAPPFKGLTPAGSPDVPLMMGSFSMRQKMIDEEKEEERKRGVDGVETDATRSDESTPSPPHSTKSALPPFTTSSTRPITPPKITNGFHPVPLSPSSSSKRSVAQSHLKSALSSLLQMHQLATGLDGGEAAREFLEVAMEVGADGLKGAKE